MLESLGKRPAVLLRISSQLLAHYLIDHPICFFTLRRYFLEDTCIFKALFFGTVDSCLGIIIPTLSMVLGILIVCISNMISYLVSNFLSYITSEIPRAFVDLIFSFMNKITCFFHGKEKKR
jgi:hypothetical protein